MAMFRSVYATCMCCAGNQVEWKVKEDERFFVLTKTTTALFCSKNKTRHFVEKKNLSYICVQTESHLVRLVLALICCALDLLVWLFVQVSDEIFEIVLGLGLCWVFFELCVTFANHKCGVREVVFFAGEKVATKMQQMKAKQLSELLKEKGTTVMNRGQAGSKQGVMVPLLADDGNMHLGSGQSSNNSTPLDFSTVSVATQNFYP